MKLKLIKFLTLSLITITSCIITPNITSVLATDICASDAAQTVKDAAGCSSNGADKIEPVIGYIIQQVVGILGIICVIIIIIGGIQYMTSAGDPSKTKKAKDTILYAVIGMIICVLAFAITTFIINAINK